MTITANLILSYASYYGSRFEDFLVAAHEQGFTGAQLIPDQAPNLYDDFTTDRRETIRRIAGDLGISLHFHNVFYDINIVSMVPAVRRLALDITNHVFDLAHDCGAMSVTVHPGYMFGGWRRDTVQRERFWSMAEESLRELGNIPRSTGLQLLVENGSYHVTTATGIPRPVPLHLAISPEELCKVISLSGPLARVTLDINKAIHSGVPLSNFLDTVGREIDQFQISTAERYKDELVRIARWAEGINKNPSFVLEGSRTEVLAARQVLLELFP